MNRSALVATALAAGLFACGAASAAAPAIEDFGKLPAVEQMSLSPSGDQVAYLALDGEARKLVIGKPGAAPTTVVNIGSVKPRDVEWLGENHVLIQVSQTVATSAEFTVDRLETLQSTIVDVATGKLTNVFSLEPLIYHATFGFEGYARRNGTEYGYFRGLTLGGSGNGLVDFTRQTAFIQHGYTDLYEVDLATGHAQKVAGGSEKRDTRWVVSAEGAVVGQSDYLTREGRWSVFPDTSHSQTLLEAKDPTGDFYLMGQGRTPGSLLVHEPLEDGDWAFVEIRRDGPSEGVRLFPDKSLRDVIYDPLTHLLVGSVSNEEPPRTELIDPVLQAKLDKAMHPFRAERVALISASAGYDRVILHTDGAGDSGTYFYVDVGARKAFAVGWDYPTVMEGAVAAVSLVDYKAADGLDLQGVLTLPPGREAKNLPVVVLPHGGPEARDYLGFDYLAQAFASRGYAVFQPNFRGSGGYGKAFRDAGFGQWGRKMQTDISDGLAALARQGVVDAKRACIVGASYGGYAALAGVTVQHGLYRCAVSYAGLSDLTAMLAWEANQAGEVSPELRYWRKYMGVTSDDNAALRGLSPAKLADQADAPILLLHGKDDTTVPLVQSQLMRDALKKAGKPVDMIVLPGEDHYLSRQASRIQMITAAVAFVMKLNPPD
ncbi:MAG: S9 family peptidase [Proteobacteria bacterium]|nr:S9 family peptidase [Pseudomonadota bacterium]